MLFYFYFINEIKLFIVNLFNFMLIISVFFIAFIFIFHDITFYNM